MTVGAPTCKPCAEAPARRNRASCKDARRGRAGASAHGSETVRIARECVSLRPPASASRASLAHSAAVSRRVARRPRAALFLHALPVMSTAFPSVALALFAYAFISNVALAVVPHEPAIVCAGARLGIWTTAVIATAGTVLASWVDHRIFVPLVTRLQAQRDRKSTRLNSSHTVLSR